MRFPKFLTLSLVLCGSALVVTGCEPKERLKPIYPRSADLQAIVEPAPIAPPEIVTSDAADELYRAKRDSWADRISAAGGRICRWAVRSGAIFNFNCPPARVPDPE